MKELGLRPWAFALSYGRVGTYMSQVIRQLQRSGLEFVFSALTGSTQLPCPRHPYCRLVVGPDDDLRVFSMKLFKQILNSADLVVADGMPLVWLGRWQGCALRRRVYGPELMETFCRKTGQLYRHYFYGGGPGVAGRLADILKQPYEVHVVGTYSPPFRPLTEEEKVEVDRRIQAAAPDVVWVGMITPKQERWMYEHRSRLSMPVMAGVGAAFNFITGVVKQAPAWMQENGLEWFFRLTQEPRRLWRRYLIIGSEFAWNVSLELLRLKKFE
jgi:N-acetylglucosaminyldiphosphoundecaprenol N-acetyl-beta-D-mannosaminyltransferase